MEYLKKASKPPAIGETETREIVARVRERIEWGNDGFRVARLGL